MCHEWRNYSTSDGIYNDVYDGKIWKDFPVVDGQPFLSLPYNFAFQLNIDWFQPYEHTQHSEGVIYMAILNLPRKQRYLQENLILVGVIPGPKEPKNIIPCLQPLVDELWKGVIVKNLQGTEVLIRAALLCVACDVPVACKVCGFVGHNGLHGCSRCLCKFPTAAFGEDYSNFDKSTWAARDPLQHREQAIKHKACNTAIQQKY